MRAEREAEIEEETPSAGEIVKESAPEAVAYVLGKLQEKHYI